MRSSAQYIFLNSRTSQHRLELARYHNLGSYDLEKRHASSTSPDTGVISLRGTSFKSDIHPPPSMQPIPSADKTRTHFQYNPCKPRDRSKTTRRNRHLGYERAGLSGANCRRVVDTIPALSQVTFRHHDVCIVKAPLHLTGQYIHVNTRAGVARSVGMMGKVRVD
jgi:hypothetical protein